METGYNQSDRGSLVRLGFWLSLVGRFFVADHVCGRGGGALWGLTRIHGGCSGQLIKIWAVGS